MSQVKVAPAIFYTHQTSGTSAGMCAGNCMHQIDTTAERRELDWHKTVTGHDGHDAVPNKQGAKVHFTPSKAIFATADESDSDKNTELSADGDKESKNNSDEMEKNNDHNKSKVNSGQFETFISSVKGSLKVSDFVLYKVLLEHQNSKFLRFTSLVKSSKKWNQHH